MSGTRLEQVIRYVSAAGDGESWWIRLEQERADETLTVEEAAELIDTLYKTGPCSRGGPDASSDEEPPADPPREDYDDLAAGVIGDACAEASHWIAHVRVYRSHQKPDYVLRSATAEVLSTETGLRESVRQVIENAGNSVDLEYPYAGDLVLPPGVSGEVRGSTLNLSRPAGRLVVRYTTVYDRVALRVPVPEKAGRNESDEDAARRAALDAAGLIAFWNRLAHAIVLEPPPQDEETDAAELADLCRASAKYRPGRGGCWERLAHYALCRCTDAPAPDSEWEETVGADCPEGVRPGSYLGVRRVLDGYGDCPGQEEDVYETAFYEETCCTWPSKPLPRCRRIVRDYRGGAPIEGGVDSWRARYGGDVTFTAVAPPDGICGKEITTWNVEKQNCCDGVPPLRPDPDNPVEITVPGRGYGVSVLDGKGGVAYRWRVTGGLVIAQTGTTEWTVQRRDITVQFDEGLCPRPTVTVSDGCTTLRMEFRGPDSAPPRLSSTDLTLAANTRFWLQASGGVRPYMWMATGGLRMLGWSQDGASALFETGGRLDWCSETVTVIDQCGNQDSCGVRNVDTGRWVRETRPRDRECDPPPVRGGMYERDDPLQSSVNWTVPRGGYRLLLGWDSPGYFSECMVYHNMPTCGPMALFSDGGEKVLLPAFCARPVGGYHSQEVDPSCGCRAKNSRGQTVYAAFGEYVIAVEQWVCG